MNILITTTSFQDSYGKHHQLLDNQGWEVDFLRGPLKEDQLIKVISKYDGVLCGDDEYTRKVLSLGKSNNLKAISKYGVGLDKIDLDAADEYNIKVTNCPALNHVSVAEHVFALIFSYEKNIVKQYLTVQNYSWERMTGNEIRGKTIGIFGFGSIGKEVAKIAYNLGLNVTINDQIIDEKIIKKYPNYQFVCLKDLLSNADYVSIHIPLNSKTIDIVDFNFLKTMKKTALLINTARGGLINSEALITALEEKKIRGYLCDVLSSEPITSDEPLIGLENTIITPHIASRTKENIVKQGIRSLKNLINNL